MTLGTVGLIGAVAMASAATAVFRYLLGVAFNDDFPTGTLIANLVASFALGVIANSADPIPVVVGIGAMGALSTWSTVANEVAELARTDKAGLAGAYLALTVTAGTVFAWCGLQVADLLL